MSVEARITRDPIDPAALLERVAASGDGAAVLFVGVVRDHNDGARVTGLTYEAYGDMASRVLEEIAREAGERLGTDRLVVAHRVGELAVGEVSVAIAASSPHRAESFDATRYVIEEIKKRLPVWKKEHYVEGGSDWLDGAVPPVEATGE
jgi:molybdopterin synthase catalytic subunit